jgi:hypothetical protein
MRGELIRQPDSRSGRRGGGVGKTGQDLQLRPGAGVGDALQVMTDQSVVVRVEYHLGHTGQADELRQGERRIGRIPPSRDDHLPNRGVAQHFPRNV